MFQPIWWAKLPTVRIFLPFSYFDCYRLKLKGEPLNCPVDRNILIRDKVGDHTTTNYGIPPNNIRAIPELSKFKLAISDLKFDADCYTSVVNLIKFYLNYSVHQYFFNPASVLILLIFIF